MATQTQQAVNTTTAGNQGQPVVTTTDGGGYFVAWVDANAYGSVAGTVKGQYFDANGNMIGAEIDLGTARVEGNNSQDGSSLTLTTLADGNIAVAWTAESSDAIDGSGTAIANVIVDNATQTASAEQVVNTTTVGNQGLPVITATDDGGYFIAWSDANVLANPAGTVKGQFYDADGNAIGTEISIGTSNIEGSNAAEGAVLVAETLDGGDIVVSWVSDSADAADGSGTAIVQSIVDAGTQTAGPEIVVNTSTASHQGQPVITATDDGGHFVSWVGTNAYGNPAGQVQGQFFDAAGNKISGEITIGTSRVEGNDAAEGQTLNATVLDNGDIVVTWTTEFQDASDGNGTAIGYSVIDGTTMIAGAELVANTTVAGNQGQPVIHATPDGGFIIIWIDNAYNNVAGIVRGQYFDETGAKTGAELNFGTARVEGSNAAEGGTLNVEVLDSGRVVVTWVSESSDAVDGSGTGVAQFVTCFAAGMFIDTPGGPVPVEHLEVGDLVSVQDGPPLPIRWIGHRRIQADELAEKYNLRPVRILAGALGSGLPVRDLLVSRQHRMLVSSKIVERMFDTSEVLIPAIKLTELPGIFVDESVQEIDYFHILLDKHKVIYAEGAPSESLYTGPDAMKALNPEARREVLTLFPKIADMDFAPEPAKLIPGGKFQKQLIARHLKNNKDLLQAVRLPNQHIQ